MLCSAPVLAAEIDSGTAPVVHTPQLLAYTLDRNSPDLLTRPRPGLSAEQRLEWSVGRSFAVQPWVAAPSTTIARDGLGPRFNANSCAACHINNGQGELPVHSRLTDGRLPDKPGLILRLGVSTATAPPHHLGQQLQDRALPGTVAEGRISWQPDQHRVAETPLPFRRYFIADTHTGDDTRPDNIRTAVTANAQASTPAQSQLSAIPVSARLAPALIGMGLVDAIADEVLVSLADPDDRNGDGISGRVNQVWDRQQQRQRPGRFGWKAGQPSLSQQIALAFAEDMGIHSTLYPDNAPPEISAKLLQAVRDYTANLAIPSAAPAAPSQSGQQLFQDIGCADCHRPNLPVTVAGQRLAVPLYSDLLLHDMGPALADAVTEASATGQEWRTAPLWGLGLRDNKDHNSRLLHDGRATSTHEAILWHGGEARASQQNYLNLNPQQQAQLLQFLQAL